jgi:hypothetical protein
MNIFVFWLFVALGAFIMGYGTASDFYNKDIKESRLQSVQNKIYRCKEVKEKEEN